MKRLGTIFHGQYGPLGRKFKTVGRWAKAGFLLLFAAVWLALTPHAVSAASVTGLGKCTAASYCDLNAVGNTFPNYSSICSYEDCNFVTAANWEQVAESVVPSKVLLAADYHQAGQTFNGGLSLPNLWTYWRSYGIDGLYLTQVVQVSRNETATENAVATYTALIEVNYTRKGQYVGPLRFTGSGTQIMLVDGFTPKGPLVVYEHRTLQMTWAQWRTEARTVWSLAVSSTPPGQPPPAGGAAPTATMQTSTSVVPSTGATITLTLGSTNALSCQLSSVPSLWAQGYVTVPCQGSYGVTFASSSAGGSWQLTFTVQGTNGTNATATATITQEPAASTAYNLSLNWSGYVVSSSGPLVTDAEGTFVVPSVDCSSQPNGQVAVWVGIGGVEYQGGGSSGALLQTGVSAACLSGVPEYFGWWELYPSTPNQSQPFTSFTVTPGDTIHAAVYQATSGAWVTRLDDLSTGLTGWMITGESWGVGPTSGNSFTIQGSTAQLSYSGGYTAEWIVEDPGNASTGNLFPFPNFGSVMFTNLLSSFSNWSLTYDETWAIDQSGVILSTPTSAGTDDFTVTYTGP